MHPPPPDPWGWTSVFAVSDGMWGVGYSEPLVPQCFVCRTVSSVSWEGRFVA